MSLITEVLANFMLPAGADGFFDFMSVLWSSLPDVVSGLVYFVVFVNLWFAWLHMIR